MQLVWLNSFVSLFVVQAPLTALRWGSEQRLLFAGTPSGSIDAWSIDERGAERVVASLNASSRNPWEAAGGSAGIASSSSLNGEPAGHTDAVTALACVPRIDTLASASLDRSVRLWDVRRRQEKKALHGHRKAITSLEYSDDFRFLVTGSFDHDVCLWSPFADKLVYRLVGHQAPIVAACFVARTPQIFSCDTRGVVKVWDARTFACCQTFDALRGGGVDDDDGAGASVDGTPYDALGFCATSRREVCLDVGDFFFLSRHWCLIFSLFC